MFGFGTDSMCMMIEHCFQSGDDSVVHSMRGASRSSSLLSSRFLLSIFNCCFPGSRAKLHHEMAEPVVIPARTKHTATIIFLHGLGDSGHGWSSVFADEIRHDHIKYICPHAPTRAVTLNFGMQMPAWFDLYGLTPNAEEDEDGINESTMIVHSLIDAEIRTGIPAERIMIGGFSMGGALALFAGLTYGKPLAGILGLSAFLVQRTKVPGNHTANKNVHIFMGHGGQDFLVPVSFGQMTEAHIKAFDPNIRIKVYPSMAHSSCPEELVDVKEFISQRLPKI